MQFVVDRAKGLELDSHPVQSSISCVSGVIYRWYLCMHLEIYKGVYQQFGHIVQALPSFRSYSCVEIKKKLWNWQTGIKTDLLSASSNSPVWSRNSKNTLRIAANTSVMLKCQYKPYKKTFEKKEFFSTNKIIRSLYCISKYTM